MINDLYDLENPPRGFKVEKIKQPNAVLSEVGISEDGTKIVILTRPKFPKGNTYWTSIPIKKGEEVDYAKRFYHQINSTIHNPETKWMTHDD